MNSRALDSEDALAWPSVSIVFLVHNRCAELRESLKRMVAGCRYPADRLEVIVVDNASMDGSAAMVAREFPQAHLVVRDQNIGVSGFNDGFAVARGDYVLALDDDCYLQPDDLNRAVEAAQASEADLVSFGVASADEPSYRFDRSYRTGLLTFWGCAVLMRRSVLDELGGYDPEIFVWANELEFMLRFFDRGFRHLHMPEVVAVHMKQRSTRGWQENLGTRPYRINARHFAYVAAKLMRPRDAIEALIARLAVHIRDGIRANPAALRALPDCMVGFLNGLRHRSPVANPEVSRAYRRHFHSFASPWWVSRPLREFLPIVRGRHPRGRREQYFTERARYYPTAADTLDF